jgi:hypothetical protein
MFLSIGQKRTAAESGHRSRPDTKAASISKVPELALAAAASRRDLPSRPRIAH